MNDKKQIWTWLMKVLTSFQSQKFYEDESTVIEFKKSKVSKSEKDKFCTSSPITEVHTKR